jgi:uncharacterized membrane protein
MTTSRLEAFSDGVIAIIITIMVLEIRPPVGHSVSDWLPLIPTIIAYVFSFIVIAIYWNNHHHLLRAAEKVTPRIMWANMHLLFWLSLIPVATAWLGEHGNFLNPWPVAIYAIAGFAAGVSYYILTMSIIAAHPSSRIAERIGKDRKGLVSQVVYIAAIITAFIYPPAALAFIWTTAGLWFIPDRRLAE